MRRVIMKNIFKLFIILFCFDASAATVSEKAFAGLPEYLFDAANAWAGIFSEFGPGAEVASYINEIQTSDVSEYLETISILGFNNTAIALLEVDQHISQSFNVIDSPLVARRNSCTNNLIKCEYGRRMLVIDGQVFGSFADYQGNQNNDFKTNNTGFVVNAKSFLSDGWLVGAEYTRSLTDTHDSRAYSDATSNSVTLFTQYLSESGFFMNFGLNAGHTSWNIDKSLAGIDDNGTYDTYFYAGQMNFGARMLRGRISMIPSASVRYALVTADKYIDAVAQEFDDWWYNTMTASVDMYLGFDFIGSDFVVRPGVRIGGGYDIISHGTDNMRVQLIDNQFYDVPVEAPKRAVLNTGLGIDFFNEFFTAGLVYSFDMRSHYTVHTVAGKLKIAF